MYKSEYLFTWKIENISFCCKGNGEKLSSPRYVCKILDDFKWNLDLYLWGDTPESEFISCYLYGRDDLLELSFWSEDTPGSEYLSKIYPDLDNAKFYCKIEIIGLSGERLKSLQFFEYEKCGGIMKWGSSQFLATSELIEEAEKNEGGKDVLTVCCRLYFKNTIADVFDGSTTFHTNIEVSRYCFLMIAYFKDEKFIIKEGKKFFNNNSSEFTITAKNDIISIQRSNSVPCFCDCLLVLLDENDFDSSSERNRHYFKQCNDTWEIRLGKFANKVKNNTNAYRLNSISIKGGISHSTGIISHSIKTNESNFNTISSKCTREISSLSEDMLSMFCNKKLIDVKFCVDDQVLEAHKYVLVARSPVFAVMFDQDMTETQMGIVDIVDIDAPTLKIFLQFLYTDSVDQMKYEIASNLLIVAEKYQVLSLKEKCAVFLKTEISAENVCEILTLSDAVNHSNLNTAALNFVIKNAASILSSSHWKTWMKSNLELAAEILAEYSLKISVSKT